MALSKHKKDKEKLEFLLRAHGIDFRKEYQFYSDRRWRFDYAIIDKKIAIEYDGGTFMRKSGHNTGTGIEKDIIKHNVAHLLGWRVFRVTGALFTERGKYGQYINNLIRLIKEPNGGNAVWEVMGRYGLQK